MGSIVREYRDINHVLHEEIRGWCDHLKFGYAHLNPRVGNKFKTLGQAVEGNLWIGLELRKDMGESRRGQRFVALTVIDYEGNNEWRTRTMDETVGPHETNCPKKILDWVNQNPIPRREFAKEWHEKALKGAK